jgi:predicted nucleotidyltransferase
MTAPLLIYETLHGSRAYNLARPDSDWDYKGIIIGPKAWYYGVDGGPEQIELGPDHVHFEVRKFCRLAEKANPTLLEVLFTEAEDRTVCTPLGERLVAARDIFLSKRVAGRFGGYALSQLKRIKTHRRWLLTPPKTKPTRAEYGLPERAVAAPEQLGAFEAMEERGTLEAMDVSANFMHLLVRERKYRAARKEWTLYQTWLKQRNPKRAALEERFGYDTKHALHLVRLMRMGREILEDGVVRVRRADRDELLSIRDGAWSYDELIERAEALHARIKMAATTSSLPDAADGEAINRLCIELIETALKERSND